MTKLLERAIAEVGELPEADQEHIGRQLLSHVEKLRQLRVELDKGVKSLDGGKGQALDVDAFIEDMNSRHAGR